MKHNSYTPPTSPLQNFLAQNTIDLDADATLVDKARNAHDLSKEQAMQAEDYTQKKDQNLAFVMKDLEAIGGFLKKFYGDNDKALGNWGFTVDNSQQKPKERISTIKPGDKISLTGVVLGSTLENLTDGDLHLYKGKTTTGNPTIIHTKGKYGIMKGFSSITISNPNEFVTAKVKVMMTR